MRWPAYLFVCVVVCAAALLLRPPDLGPPPPVGALVPNVSLRNPGRVTYPQRTLAGIVAVFHDELFAWLMFDYIRGASSLRDTEVLLSYDEKGPRPEYRVLVAGSQDLQDSAASLSAAKQDGIVTDYQWVLLSPKVIQRYQQQTRFFEAAYNLPIRRTIEQVPRNQLSRYVQRFLRFKSVTDPRVRRRMQPVPEPLSDEKATRLASDIISVASFYDLPLDLFLGIGAMENNYMNVRGDLKNTAWKRRPEKGDVVLRRARGRVLVLNDSAGVWQVTRETLRYVHRLYLADTRDYSKLPERLRPPKELDIENVQPEVLTTYAGLLFRDLLDQFNGDVTKAVGAYNGGVDNPNAKYQAGVEQVARFARSVLGRAALLDGKRAIDSVFLTR